MSTRVPSPGAERRAGADRSAASAAPAIAVAHLGPDPSDPGGMPAVLRGLMDSPLAAEHRLTVIPTHRISSLARRLAVFARATASLAAFCLRRGPRVVHVHVTVRGSLYRKALCVAEARALRRPVVLHVHAGAVELAQAHDRLGRLRRPVIAWAFRHADTVIAVSSATAAVASERFGARRAIVLPNAAPDPVPATGAALPEPGHGEILYLGGFADPVKGADVLLEALSEVVRSCPAARVAIAGPGDPPPALERLAAEAPGVRWAGWLDAEAKARALDEATIFVLPSTSEGLPMTLLEAMAHGKAIVATAVGGVPDVLSEREGVLVEPGDAAALAEALSGLLADPTRARRLGDAARERAGTLGVATVAERLSDLYRELVA